MSAFWQDLVQWVMAEQIAEAEIGGAKKGDEVPLIMPAGKEPVIHLHGKRCRIKTIVVDVE